MTLGARSQGTAECHPLIDLRGVLRLHASGVAVLTWRGFSEPIGMTVSTLVPLSLDPALVGFSVAHSSATWDVARGQDHVGIQLLSATQSHLAEQFATSGCDRFAGTSVVDGPYDVPLIAGCRAWLIGSVHDVITTGDHDLVVCRVEHVELGARPDASEALVHLGGDLVPCGASAATPRGV